MNWDYLAEEETEPIPDDYVWERLRNKRNSLLFWTDHRMVTDAPWDLAPWVSYRQKLRDIPKTTNDPRLAEWPEVPNV